MIKVRVLTEDGGLDYEHCSDSDLIRVYDTEFQDAVLEADVTLSEALEVHHTVESNRQKRDEGYEWLETAKSEQLVGAKLITLVLDRLTQNDTELNEALQNKVEGLRGRLPETGRTIMPTNNLTSSPP